MHNIIKPVHFFSSLSSRSIFAIEILLVFVKQLKGMSQTGLNICMYYFIL